MNRFALVHRLIRTPLLYVWSALALVFFVAGCGGGGGGGSATTSAAGGGGYTSRSVASAQVGPEGATLDGGTITLTATLAATQTVTLYERFYLAGRPGGVVGPVYDIQPDGLQFAGGGARLCLSYAGTGFSGSDLAVYTGANLDQPLNTTEGGGRQVCATLDHSSPYSIKLAQNLSLPEYSIFGSLDAKDKYYYKVTTTSGTDGIQGSYTQYLVHVECDLACMEDGDRIFKIISGGDNDGDIYIRDNGSYQLWVDVSGMEWTNLYSAEGGVEGGIAYLLAMQYLKYFTGDGSFDSYTSILDPTTNSISRFIGLDIDDPEYDRYISMVRASGNITVTVRDDGTAERNYTINESTAAITKNYISGGTGATDTASTTDDNYSTLSAEMLVYVNEVIGTDDTPDQTAGDSWDEYWRLTPNQELFAINTRNLLTGYGWNNFEAIEAYYRDRQKTMYTGSVYY